MTHFQSSALQDLYDRGFIYQCSDLEALDARMSQGPLTFYCGYDATATSLHVGNLLTVMAARLLQKHGHRPLLLVGGGTTKIGDPTDKTADRKMLSEEEIDQNILGVRHSLEAFIDFSLDGPHAPLLLNNESWLKDLGYLAFLRAYGSHFTVNRLLSFDSVKTRLERESPLSFLEFNYILIQAYDFLHLNKTYDCSLQIGGSDQWANILNGHELIRKLEKKPSFALTFPIIENASGQKMGKTLSGAVWLNAALTKPYEYWQYWRNVDDTDVVRLLKLYTELPLELITPYETQTGAALNEAKILLANEATRLAHGEACLADIRQTAATLFGSKTIEIECLGTDEKGNPKIKTEAPLAVVSHTLFSRGYSVVEGLVTLGFVKSKGEGRRLIEGGGCRVNDQKIEESDALFVQENLKEYQLIKLAAGKKKIGYLQVCQ